jgi:ATP-dependent Clp protease ATP-binding subunit ClpB
MASLVAGAMYRGEFEQRLKAVLNKIAKSDGQIILFIDEIHLIVGAGKVDGAMDAGNILKPMLARGELHCIGATTLNEYKKYIEKDQALERRFQKVLISEPNVEDTISILRGIKESFESHHGVHIKDNAIVEAAMLSNRYITDRFLPDKAIDLIDEACASVRLDLDSMPLELDNTIRRITQIKIEQISLKNETDPISIRRKEELDIELNSLTLKGSILLIFPKSLSLFFSLSLSSLIISKILNLSLSLFFLVLLKSNTSFSSDSSSNSSLYSAISFISSKYLSNIFIYLNL